MLRQLAATSFLSDLGILLSAWIILPFVRTAVLIITIHLPSRQRLLLITRIVLRLLLRRSLAIDVSALLMSLIILLLVVPYRLPRPSLMLLLMSEIALSRLLWRRMLLITILRPTARPSLLISRIV